MGSSISRFDIELVDGGGGGAAALEQQQQQQQESSLYRGTTTNKGNATQQQLLGLDELHPIPAGNVLQGNVVVEICKPLTLPRSRRGGRGGTSTETPTSRKMLPHEELSVQQQPILQLRFYGKEKVRVNRNKAQRVGPTAVNTAQQQSQEATAPGTSGGTNVVVSDATAERPIIDLYMQWPTFPSTDTSSNDGSGKKTTLPIGTYVFPFQIQLPTNLPSSTYYPVNDRTSRSQLKFRIQYKLMASLLLNKKSSSSLLNNNTTTTTNHTSNPPKTNKPTLAVTKYNWITAQSFHPVPEPVPCMIQPISQPITSLQGYIQKGHFWFGAALKNCNVVKPLQSMMESSAAATTMAITPTAAAAAASSIAATTTTLPDTSSTNATTNGLLELHVSCRNDSSAPIQRVQVSLMERVSWRNASSLAQQQHQEYHIDPHTGACRRPHPIASKVLQQTHLIPLSVLHNVPLPHLTKERKGILQSVWDNVFFGTVVTHTGGMTPEQKIQRQIYDDLMVGEHPIYMRVPQTARETYHGDLIHISHYIKIEFLTAGTFTCSPVLEIPIQILGTCPCNDSVLSATHRPVLPSGAGEAYYIAPPSPPTVPSTSTTPSQQSTTQTAMVIAKAKAAPSKSNFAWLFPAKKTETTISSPQQTKHLIPATTGVAPMVATVNNNNKSAATAAGVVEGSSMISSSSETTTTSTTETIPHNNKRALSPFRGMKMSHSNVQFTSLANLVPLSIPNNTTNNDDNTKTTTIAILLNEMRMSRSNEYEVIVDRLLDAEWVSYIGTWTPQQVGQVIATVHEFDQPRVAVLLAPHIHGGRGMTCEYGAAILHVTSTHHRAVMAQKILPLCRDIHDSYPLLLQELNGWEQTVTESTLQMALR